MPEDKLLQGVAEHQPGEEGWESLGQGCALNGVVDKSYHSLLYLDLELGKISIGDS